MRLVLVTQPTLWRPDLSDEEEARLWLGGTGDFQSESGRPYFSTRALRQAMDAYNATLMDVCRNEATECFDLAAELPSNTDVFYDDVHFTEYGATLVAGKLADYFAGLPPYAP